ncbi:MAG: NAD(+)/NADH kinase [Coriobacteriia bacterium]|nr:NAD(+)/NADH kinase [Coriobacteriia bacterium]
MRVLLVPNPANPRSVDATVRAATWLSAAGYEAVLMTDDAEACGLADHAVSRVDLGVPELVVALGGDGTILKSVHVLGDTAAPILGVNLGRLGFLSGAEADELPEALAAALAGEVKVEMRQTLSATVSVGGRRAGTYHALNEVFVGRTSSGRAVDLQVDVNGATVGRFMADGVIVATPTGSTAYSLSAGGPLVSPDVRGMVVVPVAPHTLNTRAMVVGPSDCVEITCPNPARCDAGVTVDGDQVPCRTVLDGVRVTVGDHDVRLLRLDGRGFFDVLSATFLRS